MRDESYLNKTARDAAHAGWGLIAIVAAILAVCALAAAVIASVGSLDDGPVVAIGSVALLVAGLALLGRR